MNSVSVFNILLSIGGSGVLVTLINVWFQRKNVDANQAKTKAEEAHILSQGAISQMQDMRLQLADVKGAMVAHRKWDRDVMKLVRGLDPTLELSDPPELFV